MGSTPSGEYLHADCDKALVAERPEDACENCRAGHFTPDTTPSGEKLNKTLEKAGQRLILAHARLAEQGLKQIESMKKRGIWPILDTTDSKDQCTVCGARENPSFHDMARQHPFTSVDPIIGRDETSQLITEVRGHKQDDGTTLITAIEQRESTPQEPQSESFGINISEIVYAGEEQSDYLPKNNQEKIELILTAHRTDTAATLRAFAEEIIAALETGDITEDTMTENAVTGALAKYLEEAK